MKPHEHINEIRAIKLDQHDSNKKDLKNSLDIIATDIYQKDTHFVFELIQNAEDNNYDNNKHPSLTFKLLKKDFTETEDTDGVLVIENNEIGFTKDNISAICKVGESTKTKLEGYIGEKGIGFKSVFKVSAAPYIISNGYSIMLPKDDKESKLGFIFPVWVEKRFSQINYSKTSIILPINKEFGFAKISKFLKDIELETILFLDKLTELKIEIENDKSQTIVKDDSNYPLVDLKLTKDNNNFEIHQYFVFKESCKKPSNINHEKREGVISRDISIALPLKYKDGDKNKLFSYLPVESNTGLPFIINADFILTSSRESIKEDEGWNIWLRDCLPEVFVKCFLKALSHEKITSETYKFIPDDSHVEFLEPIISEIHKILKEYKCILTIPSGKLKLPEDTSFASESLRNLISDIFPNYLLQDKFIVHPDLEKHKKKLKFIGVTELSKEEIIEIFKEKSWVESHDYAWLLACYKFLQGKLKNMELNYLPLVPIENNENDKLKVSSDQEQPIYYESLESENIKIDYTYLKIKFVAKDFIKLINKDTELKSWMISALKVYQLTAENYCMDLYHWFVKNYNSLSDDEFIKITFMISKLSNDDTDDGEYENIPILLENGKIISKRYIGDDIQSIVTPLRYNRDSGWQNLWINKEDRTHLAIMSNLYLVKDHQEFFKKLINLLEIKEYPLPYFAKSSLKKTNEFEKQLRNRLGVKGGISIYNYRPMYFLINNERLNKADKELFSKSLVSWLNNNTEVRESSNEWKKEFWNKSVVRDLNRKRRCIAFDSEFMENLRAKKWLNSTKGYIKPAEGFVLKKQIFEIFGDSFAYVDEDLPSNILELLGVKQDISFETIINYLQEIRDLEQIELSIIKKIYSYLPNFSYDIKIRNIFNNETLIYIPLEEKQWYKATEVLWSDFSSTFGDQFPSLEKYYPKLKSFFIDKLKVKDSINEKHYAYRWLYIQEQDDFTSLEIKEMLTTIYSKLLAIFKNLDKPEWWDTFVDNALIWSQNNEFVNSDEIFVGDDDELKNVFKEEDIEFVWKPERLTYRDLEPLFKCFDIQYLSAVVETTIYDKGSCVEMNNNYLNDEKKVLILSWLYSRQEKDYNKILENGILKSFLNTTEMITSSLIVNYQLIGYFDSVTKERDSIWIPEESKLYYNNNNNIESSICKTLARKITPTNYKDFATFIDLIIRILDSKEKFADNDLKMPKEVRDWSRLRNKIKTKETSFNNHAINSSSDNETDIDDLKSSMNSKNREKSTSIDNLLNKYSNFSKDKLKSDSFQEHAEKHPVENTESNLRSNNLNVTEDFSKAFDKPLKVQGKSIIPNDGLVRNHERRTDKNFEKYARNSTEKRLKNERYTAITRNQFERSDEEIKSELRDLYNGVCQICGKTFKMKNGENYFDKAYIVDRIIDSQYDTTANALCLCPEHFAKFKHGPVKSNPSFIEQVKEIKLLNEGGNGNFSVFLEICGEKCEIKYKEKHLKDLKDFIEFHENLNNSLE